MNFLYLISTECDPQRRRDIDALAGWWQRPARPLQGAGLRALPRDLLDDGIAAGDHVADRAAGIREGLLPALRQLDVGVDAIHPSLRPRLLIDNVRSQVCREPLPVPSVECVDEAIGPLDEVLLLACHGSPRRSGTTA